MAEGKINRHNHPLMVNARRDSYFAGRRDGYAEGYQKGYEERCNEIHRFYKIIIAALESKANIEKEAARRRGEING